MSSQYTIQTIPHNLSKEETIVQMVEILDHLSAITEDIFSRVNKRLDVNTKSLNDISKRIAAAASKVENLKGDKKAKTIFSSSKYPAMDVNRDYVSIFKEPSTIERARHEVKHTKYVSTYEPVSKLQFYHVKVPNYKNKHPPEGLGDIPRDTKCINDLLLFNTGRNVYKNFQAGDSLKGPKVAKNRKDQYSTSELGAAPLSISQRSSMQQANKENYFYTPTIEELPALDVPWDLPDLPGIADNVRYEFDSSSTIAPSAVNSNQIAELDLPDILEAKTEPQIIPEPPALHELPISEAVIKAEVEAVAAQIPDEIPESTVDAAPKHSVEEHISPPLPPPVVITPQNDSRASLMDAIRKAGGSKNLKKTSNQQPQTSLSKSSAPSGHLMADLHAKLMMRRKGISGSKKSDQGGGSNLGIADSAFAKISSFIPPPTKDSDAGSEVSTDDDAWNEDDN